MAPSTRHPTGARCGVTALRRCADVNDNLENAIAVQLDETTASDPAPPAPIARWRRSARSVLAGDPRKKIDGIWNAFWSGGISNPLEVIEQITYLLFIKRLDDLQTLEENKANRARAADGAARSFPTARTTRRPALRRAALVAVQATARRRDVHGRRRARLPVPAHHGRRRLGTYAHAHDATRASPSRRRRLLAKVVDLLDEDRRWRIATPRATSTSTCSARSPPPARTASSARRATSSS